MIWYHPKYYAELRKKRREQQATSDKHQAPSTKGLDKHPAVGYSRTITDGNARHAQLNASPSRIPGISGRQTHSKTDVSLPQEQSGRRHLPGIKTSSIKHQAKRASSSKPQAPSSKRQATSRKQRALKYLFLRKEKSHQVFCL